MSKLETLTWIESKIQLGEIPNSKEGFSSFFYLF